MIPYIAALGEIEQPIVTAPIPIGGSEQDWYSCYSGYDWIDVDSGAWNILLLGQVLNPSPIVSPKWSVAFHDSANVLMLRFIRGLSPIYNGQSPVWTTTSNVRWTPGYKDWRFTGGTDIIPPNLSNMYFKYDVTLPFNDELDDNEYFCIASRAIGSGSHAWASMGWIEETP